MRIAVDIDDDVLLAVRALAAERGASPGEVLSELARTALAAASSRNGVPILASSGRGARRATMRLVNDLRDDAVIP